MPRLNLLLKLGKRPAWSPYDIPRSVLRAWWNADDHGIAAFMTDDGAGLISSWSDRIYGLALTAAAGARPTYGATAFNSTKPGLTFDGTANDLVTTTLTNIPTSSTPSTIWAAGQPTTAATGVAQDLVCYGGNSNLRRLISTATGVAEANSDGVAADAGSFANATPAIVEGVFGATQTVYLNGTVGGSAAATLATATTRLRLGANSSTSASQFFGGVLRHVFITTALTTLQRQQLEGWIAWDSGIQSVLPANHPYAAAPP